MPAQMDQRFVRQHTVTDERAVVVIPEQTNLSQNLPSQTASLVKLVKPIGYQFEYIDLPIDSSLLENDAEYDTGIYKFLFKDAAMRIFDLDVFTSREFYWWFASTHNVVVLAALEIGQTTDIVFAEEFREAFFVSKEHFLSGVADSGYGEYGVHVTVDALTTTGFRVVSSYEPDSPQTDSRLPFFFGFNVFGRAKDDDEYPIWKDLLNQSIREACRQQWHHAALYAAIALEAFIDERLSNKLSSSVESAVGARYVEHMLRDGDRKQKLHVLNYKQLGFCDDRVGKQNSRIDENVFKLRNDLAHGRKRAGDVSAAMANRAIRTTVEFMWDWGPDVRELLLLKTRQFGASKLIDDELIEASQA